APGVGGSASRLAFTVQPATTSAGAVISPAVQVTVQNSSGATVSSTATITISLTPGTGTVGAVLSGTLAQAAVAGVASFSNLSVDRAGTSYTLTATATGLSSATSGLFAVNP